MSSIQLNGLKYCFGYTKNSTSIICFLTVKWFVGNFIFLKELICFHTIKYYYCLHTVKWFQVFISNTNSSIQHYFLICAQPNVSSYNYVKSLIQFWHTVKGFQVLLFNTNNSMYIVHSFDQLNIKTVIFKPYMGCYQILPLWVRVDLGVMAMKGNSILFRF